VCARSTKNENLIFIATLSNHCPVILPLSARPKTMLAQGARAPRSVTCHCANPAPVPS
jgi:hypothetical protein